MRPSLSLATIVMAALASSAPLWAQRASTAQAPERDAVRAVVESLATFVQDGNLAALDTLYADGRGVHIIEGSGVNHGWTDYRDHHLAPELDAFEGLELRYFAVEPVVRGSVAWASFRYELSADMGDDHVESEGRGTAVLEKLDDRWQVVHLHTSGRRKS